MFSIGDCKVELYNDGKIAWIQLPKDPNYRIMMALGRGKPAHETSSLACSYDLKGITYYLHR